MSANQTRDEAAWISCASGAVSLDYAAQRDPKAALLLALLWQENSSRLLSSYTALDALWPSPLSGAAWPLMQSGQIRQEAHSLQELISFIEGHTPSPPQNEAEYAQALAVGLSASLRHNSRELRQTDEIFPILHLADAVRISRALQLTDLHEPLCEFLVCVQQVIWADKDGPRIAPLQSLRRRVQTMLAVMPPDRMPVLWRMLRDSQTSSQLWPVLEKMRQPSAVPYLLDVIAALAEEGIISVVVALQNIGDASAVPYLQHLAQTRPGAVAASAAQAIAHIRRHSRGDAVQLLRASSAQHSDRTGETLLRPVQPAVQNAASEELLRPAEPRLQSAGRTSASDTREE